MVVVASGKTEENKGRGERLALLQGVGMGDYNYRSKLAVGWHRLLLYCEGEVHIAINTGIRKAREESCYRDRTRHHQ